MKNLIHPTNKARIAREARTNLENLRRIETYKIPAPRLSGELFYLDKSRVFRTLPRQEAYSIGGIHWADRIIQVYNSGSR